MSDGEILVVVSKLKKYVKDSTGMNTAGSVPEAITKKIREMIADASEKARRDHRKTLMDRDFGE